MRLFVAIQFTEEMKRSIIGTMHEIKLKGITGNYTPAQNLHLTMCFIGETKEKEKIIEALTAVKYKPFKLATSDMGNFGDILWLGTRGGQAISALAADIRTALDNAGIEYDRKKFNPHITLVRKATNIGAGKINVPKAEMMVKRVSLMKSDRVNGKMVYTEIYGW